MKDTLNLKYDDIGTGKKYRGDTLYTFNTYFGTDMQCAKDLSDNNGNFLSKVREFNKKYCSFYVDESKKVNYNIIMDEIIFEWDPVKAKRR